MFKGLKKLQSLIFTSPEKVSDGRGISQITIALDAADMTAVEQAIARRSEYPLPEGESGQIGAALAEICRGWEEMLDREVELSPEMQRRMSQIHAAKTAQAKQAGPTPFPEGELTSGLM